MYSMLEDKLQICSPDQFEKIFIQWQKRKKKVNIHNSSEKF